MLSILEKIRQAKALAQKLAQFTTAPDADLSLVSEIDQIRETLGFEVSRKTKPKQVLPVEGAQPIEEVEQPLNADQLYSEAERRTVGKRQKDNNAAVELMNRLLEEQRPATAEEKIILSQYSGNGGGLKAANGEVGSTYEYYTPKVIAQAAWGLLEGAGFAGGRVLDPSSGTGIFAATRPSAVVIDQVELDNTSGTINGLINDSDTCKTTVSPFEAVAAQTEDEVYDAIITNVPFGTNAQRGDSKKLDPKFQGETLEGYFILRTLQKLKPGGVAAFIVPTRIVSDTGKKWQAFRQQASMLAEFVGGYRLPNKVFSQTTEADTITDVIVFKKHPKSLLSKLDDIVSGQPGLLAEANVLWKPFISGKYFNGEGKRFVLGEFQAKDPAKFRDVDRVLNDDSIANISKLMTKFPDSRINWELLEQSSPEPIVYNEGDTMIVAGETLKLVNGEWQKVDTVLDAAEVSRFDVIHANLESALQAVNHGVTWADALAYRQHKSGMGQYKDIPRWAAATIDRLEKFELGALWPALVAGQAVHHVLTVNRSKGGECNYLETYPILSDAIKAAFPDTSINASKLYKAQRQFIQNLLIVYSKAAGFTPEWLGRKTSIIEGSDLAPDKAYAQLVYRGADMQGYVPIEDMQRITSGLDPYDATQWAISPDGKNITPADYYYVGNYSGIIAQINQEIDSAVDEKTKAAIASRLAEAERRIKRPNIGTMTFPLTTGFINDNAKLQFLKEYVFVGFDLEYGGDGKPKFFINEKLGGASGERLRQLKRFALYMNGNNLTTGSKSTEVAEDPALEQARIAQLKEMAADAQAKFNVWAKSNPLPLAELKDRLHNPDNLFFDAPETDIVLNIEGMNPEFKPHSYQFAEIFRQSKKFGGINAMQVGLGKTATALLSVQYAQSIGVKKKTFFIVPKGLLPNWYREAKGAENKTAVLASVDDCLFVGLRENKKGRMQVIPGKFVEDLNLIMEHRHKKIFMTAEAFQSIPVKQATMKEYVDFVVLHDPAYRVEAGDTAAERASAKAAKTDLTEGVEGKKSVPYFEQMRVDSLVFDELHYNKNSKKAREFKQAKFLSLPDLAVRGADAQVKSWYIRSQYGDGVLGLTATPITNSPIEIYSMLSMTVGEQELGKYLGGIEGTDEFLKAFCAVERSEEVDIVGRLRLVNVFTGLNNVEVLRNAFGQAVNVKTHEDVGATIELPDADEQAQRITLDSKTMDTLERYKTLYLLARINMGSPELADYSAEEIATLSHPFSLISRMSKLILAPMLDRGRTELTIPDGMMDAAVGVVEKWNSMNVSEKRDYVGKMAHDDDVTITEKTNDSGMLVRTVTVKVRAKIEGSQLVIDTLDYDTQAKFMKLVDAAKLDLSMEISPKIAALLDNIKKERANPARDGIVKQIVFVDNVPVHQPLKRAIASLAGISPAKIAIINGPAATPADMQDIQDGFNAEDDENRFEVVIANEKAEVGINLQNYCQAIHHLTIGWTPDSITQRNGRGVRQGNELKSVMVYYYDAKGTFDEYKRSLVNRKGDWMEQVLSSSGGQNVEISGSLTDQEAHDLIMAIGDEVGSERIRAEAEARERNQRAEAAKNSQVRAASIVKGLDKWLGVNRTEQQAVATLRESARSELKSVRANRTALEAQLQRATSKQRQISLASQIKKLDENADRLNLLLNDDDVSLEMARSEIEWRTKALEQAKAEFGNSMTTKGAYGPDIKEAIDSGKFEIVNGQIFAAGMVGIVNGKPAIVFDGGGSGAIAVARAYGSYIGYISHLSLAREVSSATLYQRDTPEWLDVINQLVQFDDKNIEEGAIAGASGLFSTHSKDVKERLAKPAGNAWQSSYNCTILGAGFPIVPASASVFAGLSFYPQLKDKIDESLSQLEFSEHGVRAIAGSSAELKNVLYAADFASAVFGALKAAGVKANASDSVLMAQSIKGIPIARIENFDQSYTNLIKALGDAEFTDNDSFIAAIERLWVSDIFDSSVPVHAFSNASQRYAPLVDAFEKGLIRAAAGGKKVLTFKELAPKGEFYEGDAIVQAMDSAVVDVLTKEPARLESAVSSLSLKSNEEQKANAAMDAAFSALLESLPNGAKATHRMIEAVEQFRSRLILPEPGGYDLFITGNVSVSKQLLEFAGFMPKTVELITETLEAPVAAAMEAVKAAKEISGVVSANPILKNIRIILYGGDSIEVKAGQAILVDTRFGTPLAGQIQKSGQESPSWARYYANGKTDKSVAAQGGSLEKGWLITIEPSVTHKGVQFLDLSKLKQLA